MELLYADDLVPIAETKELLLDKVRKWKEGMEKKGLRASGLISHTVQDSPAYIQITSGQKKKMLCFR